MTPVLPPLPRAGPRTGFGTSSALSEILWTAGTRLHAAGLPTARQDAELLLAHTLGMTRLDLYVEPRWPLDTTARIRFDALVRRRAGHEPLQYLLGLAEFCRIELAVGPGVFIPRPETEALVDQAWAFLPAGPALAVDLCTGSGAIACALAVRHPGVLVRGVERAVAAAAWARRNVDRLGLGRRVHIVVGDLFGPLAALAGQVDVVVANPPYLAQDTLATLPAEVRDWEPADALDGGLEGTAVIARILDQAPAWLRAGGALAIEIGEEQGPWVRARLGADRRYTEAIVHRDFRGCERILVARTTGRT